MPIPKPQSCGMSIRHLKSSKSGVAQLSRPSEQRISNIQRDHQSPQIWLRTTKRLPSLTQQSTISSSSHHKLQGCSHCVTPRPLYQILHPAQSLPLDNYQKKAAAEKCAEAILDEILTAHKDEKDSKYHLEVAALYTAHRGRYTHDSAE